MSSHQSMSGARVFPVGCSDLHFAGCICAPGAAGGSPRLGKKRWVRLSAGTLVVIARGSKLNPAAARVCARRRGSGIPVACQTHTTPSAAFAAWPPRPSHRRRHCREARQHPPYRYFTVRYQSRSCRRRKPCRFAWQTDITAILTQTRRSIFVLYGSTADARIAITSP